MLQAVLYNANPGSHREDQCFSCGWPFWSSVWLPECKSDLHFVLWHSLKSLSQAQIKDWLILLKEQCSSYLEIKSQNAPLESATAYAEPEDVRGLKPRQATRQRMLHILHYFSPHYWIVAQMAEASGWSLTRLPDKGKAII